MQTNRNNHARTVPFAEAIPVGRATASQNQNARNRRAQSRTQSSSQTPTNTETPIPVAEGIPMEVEMVSQNVNARNGLVPLYGQDGIILANVSRAQVGTLRSACRLQWLLKF